MMSDISKWILSIAGVVLLGVLLELMLPEGRTHKYIRGIFGMITVFVIIAPLPSLLKKNYSPAVNTGGGGVNIDSGFITEIYRSRVAAMEDDTARHLRENGYKEVKVAITVDGYTDKLTIIFVHADVKNMVISDEKKNIDNYDDIRALISAYLNAEREKIIIYS